MQNLPFTLRQLVIFETLAETRSFRRSAELLGISQASVSSQVKALEEQLGVALLLRRSGKRPDLTHEGENYLSDLRLFRTAAAQLAGHRRRTHVSQETVRYRVLLGQGLADYYIRPKLDQFLTRHPHIILEFDTRTPSEQLDAAAQSEKFDFVLIHRDVDRPINPPMRSLGRVPSGIYGDRRLAEGKPLPLSAEETSHLPFVLGAASDDGGEARVRRALAAFNVSPTNIVARVQFFDVIIAMLDRGQAVTNMPGAMIPLDMRPRIVSLFPMHDWRLVFLRQDDSADEDRDAIERFLLDSVLKDPAYLIVDDATDRS